MVERADADLADADTDDAALPAPRESRITLLHRIEYGLVRALVAFFRLIGVEASSALAGGFLRVVGPMLRTVSRRGEENLRAAYPEWSDADVRRTVAGVWENLGRTAAEFAHLDKFSLLRPDGRVEVIGLERLYACRDSGRPHIFVSGHFANWEILSIMLKEAGFRYAVVYRAANNPLVDSFIIKTRARVISPLQIPKSKRSGRALIDVLKTGASLAMLVDQKFNDGISVPFLGREAMTAPAAARLALKFDAPLVTASVERLKGARFRITLHEPLAFEKTGDAGEDVRRLTILVNEALERDIRARPAQWLWLHRRWPS